ncbi:MAG: F510_1955 family glycosylhydrolase [Acidimicrobiia bacterium]
MTSNGGGTAVSDPGPVHVHGLGINPSDGALFVATHTGLFRAAEGAQTAQRVAGRYQDTMGFTVVGPDRFLGSGHPDLREKLPPYLGLIRSKDAGRTWTPVSLLGKADFHVLEASGRRVVGFGSDFRTRQAVMLRSDDGGRAWADLEPPAPLIDLALNPRDPDQMIAAGEKSLHRSSDGGRTWTRIDGAPGLLAWPADDELFRIGLDGDVARSRDRGANWHDVGHIEGEPAAFEAVADGLYAALHDGVIMMSRDGGDNWTIRSRPQTTTT